MPRDGPSPGPPVAVMVQRTGRSNCLAKLFGPQARCIGTTIFTFAVAPGATDTLKAEAKEVEIPFGKSFNAGGGVIDAQKAKVVILNKVEMS